MKLWITSLVCKNWEFTKEAIEQDEAPGARLAETGIACAKRRSYEALVKNFAQLHNFARANTSFVNSWLLLTLLPFDQETRK